ncbi:MAG: FAD-dependent oxidoreductase [Desulfobacterales bacterium]|nr:FAD-dependent oxidoreductase [Desulfobacterales bacterium]
MKLAPCTQACPLGVNCQGYVQLIARGRDEEALRILEEKLPFPEILSRLCSQPCEDNCHRKKNGDHPVNIRGLKRYLTQIYETRLPSLPAVAGPSGKTVAIVGAGPAGLTAAFDLSKHGHAVTLFDAEAEPGGMLRWAVPEFRMPGRILGREIDRLLQMGVHFQGRQKLGRDIRWEDLTKRHDAVLIAIGCSRAKRLGVEGENLRGVQHALSFLKSVREGRPEPLGRRVVVVGGGDVAVDCAQTARRLGAEAVVIVSLEDESVLPAHPNVVASAKAEGILFRGAWGPQALLGDKGVVQKVQLKKCVSVFDADANFKPMYDMCQLDSEEADSVIIAIGQAAEMGDLFECGIATAHKLVCDPMTLQVHSAPVFAAGDIWTGPTSVVHAMASGRRAAESVHRFLSGEDLRFGRGYAGPCETDFPIDTTRASLSVRSENPLKRFEGPGDFAELEEPFDSETARREASRCYSCGEPFGKYRTCWFCLPCEVECPQEALWVEIPYLLR